MTSEDSRESYLTLKDGDRTRHWLARLDGATLTQATWVDEGKPRETVREFSINDEAAAELDSQERRRYTKGYVRLRDFEEVEPGEAVLECYGPALHDLSVDGSTMVLARYGAASDRWCRLELVSTATGERRVAFEEPGSGGPSVHAALFDHSGRFLVVQMNTSTFRVDLQTGSRKPLAHFTESITSRFNQCVVQPSQDTSRRRLVVFDAGDLIRVLENDAVILEVSTASSTTECRGGRISDSGKLLAVYRVSRGLVYSHPDAQDDTTNEVEVWDVDAGQLRTKITMPEQVRKVAFDPADELLIVSFGYYGPAAFSLLRGSQVWRYGGSDPSLDSICHGWCFSPDGSLLAVGRTNKVCLYRGKARKPVSYPDPEGMKADRIVFSGDGRIFATERGLNVVVRKTP